MLNTVSFHSSTRKIRTLIGQASHWMHLCRVLISVSRCISYWQFVPVFIQNDFKMALNLDIRSSERAHAQFTNVQCSKTLCKYHKEEICGRVLYIYRD